MIGILDTASWETEREIRSHRVSVPFKIEMDQVCRRFSVPIPDGSDSRTQFRSFDQLVKALYNLPMHTRLAFSWVDEEGSLVLIESDLEWIEAVRWFCERSEAVFKLQAKIVVPEVHGTAAQHLGLWAPYRDDDTVVAVAGTDGDSEFASTPVRLVDAQEQVTDSLFVEDETNDDDDSEDEDGQDADSDTSDSDADEAANYPADIPYTSLPSNNVSETSESWIRQLEKQEECESLLTPTDHSTALHHSLQLGPVDPDLLYVPEARILERIPLAVPTLPPKITVSRSTETETQMAESHSTQTPDRLTKSVSVGPQGTAAVPKISVTVETSTEQLQFADHGCQSGESFVRPPPKITISTGTGTGTDTGADTRVRSVSVQYEVDDGFVLL
ncbi:uncharacterized protein BJ171DRAFT_570461 [Polychytrium aggregatum]|uniref:uncharacterized protein n=1 Tax=Polychytrium aggregatum TaxID=110093 RepID=UPI0022FEC486|nr:uncharacterized protein BJ171DRAFT_570461 [Polychytrium aggregatum]KAI9199465.1 hypothetical protein BJ171DRAFT_570461 [Polychytrium aggregatum]